jgi:hypothetical protein
MKINIFKMDYNSCIVVQDANNPTNLDLDIDDNYFGHVLKTVPKKYHKDIRDNYITTCTLTKKQVDRLTELSELNWIRDGKAGAIKK